MVSLTTKIITDPEEILKDLQLGIQIPILPDFYKYILRDFKAFNAKAIISLEDKNTCGFVLLFHANNKLLNFGYFKILDDNPDKISYMIDEIIKYAKLNNFQQIKGPINIPTIIYGWGFMEENSNCSLFACCPLNPPIYQKLFYKKGFKKFLLQYNWEGILPRVNPWRLKEYNFEEYEYFNPKNYEEFNELKSIFLKIQGENLPSSSQVTPNPNLVFESYAEYIFEFGFNFMIFFIRFKPTDQIIACGSFLPNPFRKDNKGNFDSCMVYTWAVEPTHRRKGLAMLMYGATSIQAWKHKIRYGIGPVGSNIKANMELGKKLGASIGRTYVVLEFMVK